MKITDHDRDKYITTPGFNAMAANVFNTRLEQANGITKKQILMLNGQVLIKRLLQIKQNIYL